MILYSGTITCGVALKKILLPMFSQLVRYQYVLTQIDGIHIQVVQISYFLIKITLVSCFVKLS